MNSNEDLLSFLDLLDLSEDLVDSRLKSIISRSDFNVKHLKNAIQLLQYKHLINIQDQTDCENDEEYNFLAKLFGKVSFENIDYICKITNIVLCLNKSSMVSKAEHLLQQILLNVDSHELDIAKVDANYEGVFFTCRLCDSILNAVLRYKEKVTLMFLDKAVENILNISNEKFKVHFLLSTVPKLIEGTVGYSILDGIWNLIKSYMGEKKEDALKILSCLSEYYLPVPTAHGCVNFESEITSQIEFWNIILYGLSSQNSSIRKMAIYLVKRAIDYLISLNKNVQVQSNNQTLFSWQEDDKLNRKKMWDNYFILLESLEEKQSNIVLPSLQLFELLTEIDDHWLRCAFALGLKHDNTQVRLHCIEYRLRLKINSISEATLLLEALNDLNLYDDPQDYEPLKEKFSSMIKDKHSFVHIINASTTVKWSPVPLYHLTHVINKVPVEVLFDDFDMIIGQVTEWFKIPCNNIPIRKAIYVNISRFIGKFVDIIDWRVLIKIFPLFQFPSYMLERDTTNPIVIHIRKNIVIKEEEKADLFVEATNSLNNIDFIVLYVRQHYDDVDILTKFIEDKYNKIQNVLNRSYSNKLECYNDVLYVMHLYIESKIRENLEPINVIVTKEYRTIATYIYRLLSDDTVIDLEEVNKLFKGFDFMCSALEEENAKDILVELFKASILFIEDSNTSLDKKVFSLSIIHSLINSPLFNDDLKHKLCDLKGILKLLKYFEANNNEKDSSVGRLKNTFYGKHCAIIEILLNDTNKEKYVKEVVEFIETVIDCGGYGCLLHILRIANKILNVLVNSGVDFDLVKFISRMWKEIDELKSNNQYNPCIEEFVCLITQNSLLEKSEYNNVLLSYYSKIIEHGAARNTPLFYLVTNLSEKDLKLYPHLIYILCEIILYSPVPRKDQRIIDNLSTEIIEDSNNGLYQQQIYMHFNYQIQYLTLALVLHIECVDTLSTITTIIMTKIDSIFKNKTRYHKNSQLHRILLSAVQYLLLIFLKFETNNGENIMLWCLDSLGRISHEPSVRICLEWFVACYFYAKRIRINDDLLKILRSKKIPVTSELIILFRIIKNRLLRFKFYTDEYDLVMDTFLGHTMGAMFNVRLQAQYFASLMYPMYKVEKYDHILQIINKTLTESADDKNLIKLKDDYFINANVVDSLTPVIFFYFLPKYFDVTRNERIDISYIRNLLSNATRKIYVRDYDTEKFKKEWRIHHHPMEHYLTYDFTKLKKKEGDDPDTTSTIQKKYIPWKNMSEVNNYELQKMKGTTSELIVVASLIDKLPNLGGMARTSEVFGVKTYVVDSLRHLQDKQFQGLSVSAERWINIEEVRPGRPLKDYLSGKKTEGYTIVAAEQTSTSCSLNKFKFPKKTLLLLGHEKEGVPCDLLPMMDHCVEVPQLGFVRSLNVHVTAAIFVWEYARQHML